MAFVSPARAALPAQQRLLAKQLSTRQKQQQQPITPATIAADLGATRITEPGLTAQDAQRTAAFQQLAVQLQKGLLRPEDEIAESIRIDQLFRPSQQAVSFQQQGLSPTGAPFARPGGGTAPQIGTQPTTIKGISGVAGQPQIPTTAQIPTVGFEGAVSGEQKIFEDLSRQIAALNQPAIQALQGAPSRAAELQRLRQQEIEPLQQPIQNLRALAESLGTSIEELPQDINLRTQDFAVTEAQRRRREAVEREPLTRQLAKALQGVSTLEGERAFRTGFIQDLIGAGESDLARQLQIAQLQTGPQQELLQQAIGRQLDGLSAVRAEGRGTRQQQANLAAQQLLNFQQGVIDLGLQLDPTRGAQALQEIQTSSDPLGALQKYLRDASAAPALQNIRRTERELSTAQKQATLSNTLRLAGDKKGVEPPSDPESELDKFLALPENQRVARAILELNNFEGSREEAEANLRGLGFSTVDIKKNFRSELNRLPSRPITLSGGVSL